MNLLPRRVRTRQPRPGFPEAEVELPKQALALPHAELDSVGRLNPSRQRFAVPQVDPHSGVAWFGPQHPIDFLDLPFVESTRPAGPHALSESGKTFLLIAMDPILHRPRCVAEQSRYLRTGQTLRDQQDTMQPVIVARLFRTLDLLL